MTREPVALDLDGVRRIHVCNVGGAGMSAIATLLAQMGHRVSGVDDNETPFLPALRALGVDVRVAPGAPDVAATADVVVTSTATRGDHPDLAAASAAGAVVGHRGDALAAICRRRQVTAVSGTHGKSTTAAMLATIDAGLDTGAGYLVGTRVTGLGTNAAWQRGPGLVVEADESDGTFLRTDAHHVVVTNLEADHLSYWGTEAALVEGFRTFVRTATGRVVLCLDDPGAAALAGAADPDAVLTYGTDDAADLRIASVEPAGLGVAFDLSMAGVAVPVEVPAAPGIHNARNAAGAVAAAVVAGIDLADAAAALGDFAGVARRFEFRGEVDGVTFVDSYDHLPTEVSAALTAATAAGFERVVCVFQPHRYTRTRDLGHTFGEAFVAADVLVVTDLYPAGEPPIDGVSGRIVFDAVRAAHPDADIAYAATLDDTEDRLAALLRPGDLCITLNAGDLTRMPDRLLERLS